MRKTTKLILKTTKWKSSINTDLCMFLYVNEAFFYHYPLVVHYTHAIVSSRNLDVVVCKCYLCISSLNQRMYWNSQLTD